MQTLTITGGERISLEMPPGVLNPWPDTFGVTLLHASRLRRTATLCLDAPYPVCFARDADEPHLRRDAQPWITRLRNGQRVRIGDLVTITVAEILARKCRLEIEAPEGTRVHVERMARRETTSV